MTGPREWRHAELCAVVGGYEYGCTCGLSAVRDALAAGHRVVIGPDGVEGRLEQVGRVDRPSMADTFWQVEGDEIQHPTLYLEDDPEAEELGLNLPDDPGYYSLAYRLVPIEEAPDV